MTIDSVVSDIYRLPDFGRIVAHGLHPGEEEEVPVTSEHVLGQEDQVLQGLVVLLAYQPAREREKAASHR